MKRILAALFCVSLLGVPMLAQGGDAAKAPAASCCAEKQVAAKEKDCCKDKAAAEKGDCCKDKAAKQTAQKADCCASEKVSMKDCKGCEDSAQTWMSAPAKCGAGCETAGR